ncbi:beta transducin, partial [Desmophyllum pertusum]
MIIGVGREGKFGGSDSQMVSFAVDTLSDSCGARKYRHSLCLLESGKILPGVKVVIANPETKGMCADSHLGEIWANSPHSGSGYFMTGEDTQTDDRFNAKLTTGGLERL